MNISTKIQILGFGFLLTAIPHPMAASPQQDTIAAISAQTTPIYPSGSPRLRNIPDLAREHLDRELPPEWTYCEHVEQELPSEDKWWKQFDDPILNELILLAEKNNFDLRAAYQRIRSSKAQLMQTRAAWFPTLGMNAGWTHLRSSGDTGVDPDVPSTDEYTELGLTFNWQIDVFGRIAAQYKAGKADLGASEADYVATQISLSANVAKAYVTMRLAQAELAIAQEHLTTQEKIMNMTRERMECGLGNKLEVSQSKGVYLATQASIPTLLADLNRAKNTLACLCGVYREELSEQIENLDQTSPLPILTDRPNSGVPADLLRRRPDIVEAENRMAAAAARCGVAKKDFLPTLSLSAGIATQSHLAKDLFKGHSITWSVAPKLSWTLFDGMARKGALEEAKAAMQESIDNYNQTVMNAVQEVNNAICQLESSWESITLQLELLKTSRESMALSVDLYKRGLTQFSNVTDAQIDVLNQENTLVSYKAQSLQAAITLYEALGGGY